MFGRVALVRGTLGAALVLLGVCGSGVAQGQETSFCRYGQLPIPDPATASTGAESGTYTLALFYAVPTDIPYDPAVLARIKVAAADVQAWYQCATGGMTWEFAYPETVRVYHALQNRLYYRNNGDWWGSLLPEMGGEGLPIWSPGTVCGIWAQGAGWWAGAAQSCGVECGTALLGVELFPEFNNPGYSGGACPGGAGVAAWPCTPEGAFAHELGHTLGLPHPADDPSTSAVASHSIMQTHWNYPNYAPPSDRPWGFLSLERQTLLANPFMKWGLTVRQSYVGCDIVNLPAVGTSPVAAFTVDAAQPPNVFHGINTSSGADYSYWMFGDGATANTTDAIHVYSAPDPYTVTLRVMASDAMMDSAAAPFTVPALDVPMASGGALAFSGGRPNPFSALTTFAFILPTRSPIDVEVLDVSGRHIVTLLSGVRDAGRGWAVWNGRAQDGRGVRAGAYVVRLRACGQSASTVVVLRK